MGDISQATPVKTRSTDPIADITRLLMDDPEPVEDKSELETHFNTENGSIEPQEAVDQGEEGKSEDDQGNEEGKQDESNEVTWAQVLGVEDKDLVLDDNGDFKAIKITINGQDQEVDLKTLKNGFQFEQYTRQKLNAFADEKKQYDAEIQKKTTEFQQKLQLAESVNQLLEKKLLDSFNRIDWTELRANDPLEYSRQWQHFQAQYSELEQIKNAVQYESQNLANQGAEQAMQFAMKQSQANIDKLVASHPEWADQRRMIADFNEYGEFYSKEYGINNDEFAHVMLNMLNLDPRAVDIIRDAMTYRRSKDVSKNKVVNSPKFVKPSQSANTSKLSQLTRAAKKATGAKAQALQLAAVTELLSG